MHTRQSSATTNFCCCAVLSLPFQCVFIPFLDIVKPYIILLLCRQGRALSAMPGLHEEMLLLLWTMVERHVTDSPLQPFWAALPQAITTGLSADEAAFAPIAGSPLDAECLNGRQHLRDQFGAISGVIQALLSAYPQHLQPHFFTLEAYLWAASLWYAYAIQVRLPAAANSYP